MSSVILSKAKFKCKFLRTSSILNWLMYLWAQSARKILQAALLKIYSLTNLKTVSLHSINNNIESSWTWYKGNDATKVLIINSISYNFVSIFSLQQKKTTRPVRDFYSPDSHPKSTILQPTLERIIINSYPGIIEKWKTFSTLKHC